MKQGVWNRDHIGDPIFDGLTLGGTVAVSGTFAKASYPGLRAIRTTNGAMVLAVDLPDSYTPPATATGYAYGGQVRFTSSGTFTKASYPGLSAIEVECQGGGGAGGGVVATAAGQNAVGNGAQAGGYAKSLVVVSDLDTTEAVTVGAGGTGVSAAAGNDGGASVFDTISSEVRGGGGAGAGSFGASNNTGAGSPGVAATTDTGDFTVPGGSGGSAIRISATTGEGGWGGHSFYGMGGASRGNAGAGQPGRPYGGGGGGALSLNGSGAAAGGNGGAGIVVVSLYFWLSAVAGAGATLELWY
jgi:hypothetical protein